MVHANRSQGLNGPRGPYGPGRPRHNDLGVGTKSTGAHRRGGSRARRARPGTMSGPLPTRGVGTPRSRSPPTRGAAPPDLRHRPTRPCHRPEAHQTGRKGRAKRRAWHPVDQHQSGHQREAGRGPAPPRLRNSHRMIGNHVCWNGKSQFEDQKRGNSVVNDEETKVTEQFMPTGALQTLAKGDKLTVTAERLDGGKLRCTGATWADAVVIYPGEALALVHVEPQARIKRPSSPPRRRQAPMPRARRGRTRW
jgi:hypothetical protein